MFKFNTNNHKLEGKHSLARDTIFKGKIEEITEAEIIISRSYHEVNNSSIRIFNNKNLFTNIESLKKYCDD